MYNVVNTLFSEELMGVNKGDNFPTGSEEIKKPIGFWVSMAHACNPSYSGGRDQEDCGMKPTQANSSARSYLEKTLRKNKGRGGGVEEWLKV
jgi:hypothetical protein